MFSSILNFILFLVFIYLLLYAVYLLTANIKSLFSGSKFLNENEPSSSLEGQKINKLCVIIFANSKSKNTENLLANLNEQTYNKENYSVQVVYAKDSNSISYVPDCILGAQIHCIENSEYFNKNKALNLFLEKLVPIEKFDAYVFLGPNRMVAPNFLQDVNFALNNSQTGVITGKTTIVHTQRQVPLKSKIMEAKQEFKNNTLNLSRRMFELASVIDSENCVLMSDILIKTGRVCFETREEELKYSLFLASNAIKPVYCPFMETFVEAKNYNPSTAGIQTRLALFKYYLPLIVKKPWYFIEFVLFLIHPNAALVVLLYLTLLWSSFRFISSIGIKYIFHLGVLYVAIWALGILASKLNIFKILLLSLYPCYSFEFNFRKITKDISKHALQQAIQEERNVKSCTKDAIVTDGSKNVVCKMDLMTEDGMRRVILRFRKKRVISDGCIRMCDALQNISKKINSHGYTLKICQNCKHFETLQDGTVDLLKGVCKAFCEKGEEPENTIIWNRCNGFSQKSETGVFDDLGKNQE